MLLSGRTLTFLLWCPGCIKQCRSQSFPLPMERQEPLSSGPAKQLHALMAFDVDGKCANRRTEASTCPNFAICGSQRCRVSGFRRRTQRDPLSADVDLQNTASLS